MATAGGATASNDEGVKAVCENRPTHAHIRQYLDEVQRRALEAAPFKGIVSISAALPTSPSEAHCTNSTQELSWDAEFQALLGCPLPQQDQDQDQDQKEQDEQQQQQQGLDEVEKPSEGCKASRAVNVERESHAIELLRLRLENGEGELLPIRTATSFLTRLLTAALELPAALLCASGASGEMDGDHSLDLGVDMVASAEAAKAGLGDEVLWWLDEEELDQRGIEEEDARLLLRWSRDRRALVSLTRFFFERRALLLFDLASEDLPACILPRLYLSSMLPVRSYALLEHYGITHVLNVTPDIPNFFPRKLQCFAIQVHDDENVDLSVHFDSAVEFIHDAILSNHTVLVHCNGGVSRSVSMVLVFLMEHHQMSLSEALEHIQKVRPRIGPNAGFMLQLLEREQRVCGRMSLDENVYRERFARVNAPAPSRGIPMEWR